MIQTSTSKHNLIFNFFKNRCKTHRKQLAPRLKHRGLVRFSIRFQIYSDYRFIILILIIFFANSIKQVQFFCLSLSFLGLSDLYSDDIIYHPYVSMYKSIYRPEDENLKKK